MKELAFLFKLDGAAATPRASVDGLRSSADVAPNHDSNSSLRSSLRASSEAGLDSIRQRLQQYQSSAAPTSAQQVQVAPRQQAEPAQVAHYHAAAPLQQAQAHADPVFVPAAAAALRKPYQVIPAASPAPQAKPVMNTAGSLMAARPPTAAPSEPKAHPAAAKPASSRLPAPPLARASRLRPPTTSSSFFSSSATARRHV